MPVRRTVPEMEFQPVFEMEKLRAGQTVAWKDSDLVELLVNQP